MKCEICRKKALGAFWRFLGIVCCGLLEWNNANTILGFFNPPPTTQPEIQPRKNKVSAYETFCWSAWIGNLQKGWRKHFIYASCYSVKCTHFRKKKSQNFNRTNNKTLTRLELKALIQGQFFLPCGFTAGFYISIPKSGEDSQFHTSYCSLFWIKAHCFVLILATKNPRIIYNLVLMHERATLMIS